MTYIERERAIEDLEARIENNDELERKCTTSCCDPQSDSAANHWGIEYGLREAIETLEALPVIPLPLTRENLFEALRSKPIRSRFAEGFIESFLSDEWINDLLAAVAVSPEPDTEAT